MRVQHNIASMNSYRNYNNNTKSINKNLEKLSSGYKINRAGDDAAGLAISEKMRAQITGLEGAQKNAKDGISLVQTAEGALDEVQQMLNRMYSLAEQSANGTYDNSVDRNQLQKEIVQLRTEIDRIADSSNFNGIQLLNGGLEKRSSDTFELMSDVAGIVDTSKVKFTEGAKFADRPNGFDSFISGLTISATASKGDDVTAVDNFTIKMTVGGKEYSLHEGETDGNGVFGDDNQYYYAYSAGKVTITDVADGEAGTSTYATLEVGLKSASDIKGLSSTDADGLALKDIELKFGAYGKNDGLKLQIGDTAESFNQLNVSVLNIRSYKLGGSDASAQLDSNGDPTSIANIDISTIDGAGKAMAVIKSAINYVSDVRGGLGATQNRLDHTINNLSVMRENIQDAESTIRDTDVADEMMKYTKNSILVQSAQAMLAQANQQPQGVLQLLQ